MGLTELAECPVCGATGVAERIEDHDCTVYRARQRRRWGE